MSKLLPILLVTLALGACSSSDPLPQPMSNTPPPPPVAAKTNFTVFVKQVLATADETAEPVEINDLDFEFTDLDDPDAYDDVLQPGR